MTHHFTVHLEWDPDGPGYAVTVPALPGCSTQGATVPEALKRVREAVSGHVAALVESGQPVPADDTPLLLTVVTVENPELSGAEAESAQPTEPPAAPPFSALVGLRPA